MQVTGIRCVNKKKHEWKVISKEFKIDGNVYYLYAWCGQCGSLTEFVQEGTTIERVLDRNNKYLITKPAAVP